MKSKSNLKLFILRLKNFIKKIYDKVYYKLIKKIIRQKRDVPAIKKGMKIAFVCYGNICRSPFAEKFAAKNYKEYEFYSFGFIEEENRPSPENAVLAAKKWDIDLSNYKSKLLSEKDVKEMDVIFVMDKFNYILFKKLYKDYLSKVYFLDTEKEIPDPYEKDLEYFKYIYGMISENIDNIISIYK